MLKYIDKFITYLKTERYYSVNTVDAYLSDLTEFNKYSSLEVKDITYSDIRNYISKLHDKYNNKTISRHISTLRSFFKYLTKEDVINVNPMTLISNPKIAKNLPNYLTNGELEELLNIDQSTSLGIRNKLIFEILYSTGIRVSELVNIKTNDIDTTNKTIKVLGKGNKERIVIYGRVCEEQLKKYLNISRPNLSKTSNEYLIINNRGNKLTDRGVRYILDETLKKTSIDKNISPHTLRHTFATHMINEGADILLVGELLGHENISSTEIYTHISDAELRKEYRASHPRDKQKTNN